MRNRQTILGLPWFVVVAAAVVVAAVGSYAFTASNTISSGGAAGEGESPSISGYTATAVSWTLDPVSPDKIQKVAFTLSAVTAGTVVYAGADDGSSITWSNACVQSGLSGGAATETCTFGTEPATNGTTKLAVSAAD
jgi:hypothetical protein